MKVSLSVGDMPRVIAGFPGVGKSTLFRENPERYADSDSSTFDKAGFPANYIEHIKHLIETTDKTIFVSTHAAVRQALQEAVIPFALVYPDAELKPAYLERYVGRNSPQAFCDMMSEKFNDFVRECDEFEYDRCTKFKLAESDHNMRTAMQALGFDC